MIECYEVGKSYQFTGTDLGHLGQDVQIIVIQSGMFLLQKRKVYICSQNEICMVF